MFFDFNFRGAQGVIKFEKFILKIWSVFRKVSNQNPVFNVSNENTVHITVSKRKEVLVRYDLIYIHFCL